MSTIDERIVRMRFDNAQFEAGVSKTMTTLDKFKEKLKFKSQKDDFKDLQDNIDSVNFQKMADDLDALTKRFSVMGEAGATVIRELTKKVLGAAKQLEESTLGQIRSGGWSRAMNIANAKFQIEGLGFDWSQVEKAVSYGVSGTAYGLDAAASAASQLAASGVDFQEVLETINGEDITQMHKALRGISGVAAMTNSSYEDISRIFTTIAGQGRVMGDQLNQLAGRGMNAAATIAQALNTTESEVRDLVSKGAIDFNTFAEIMDNAFGDHAKDANKTFTGALSNMKAALSRIGALFADPVINNANRFFVAITSRIDEFKKALASTRGVAEYWVSVFNKGVDIASALVKNIDISFLIEIANAAAEGLKYIDKLFDSIALRIPGFVTETEEASETIEAAGNVIEATAETIKLAKEVIAGKYGNGATRISKLGAKYKEVQSVVDKIVDAGWDWDKVNIKIIDSATAAENETSIALENSIRKLDMARSFLNSDTKAKEEMIKLGLFTSEEDAKKALKELEQIENAKEYLAVPAQFRTEEMREAIGKYELYASLIEKQNEEIAKSQEKIAKQRTLDNIRYTIINLGKVVKNVGTAVVKIVKAIGRGISAAFKPMETTDTVHNFTDSLVLLSERLIPSEETIEKITILSYALFNILQSLANLVVKYVGKIIAWVSSLGKARKATSEVDETVENVGRTVEKSSMFFDMFISVLDKVADFITDLPEKITTFVRALSQNEGVIKLKETFSDLKDVLVELIKGAIAPAGEKLKEFSDNGIDLGEGASVGIGLVAAAIGWVADKLAWVFKQVPSWIEKLEEVADKVSEVAKTIYTEVKDFFSGLDIKGFWENTTSNIENIFSTDNDTSLFSKVKEGFSAILENFTQLFENLDWERIGHASKLLIGIAMLWKVYSGLSSVAEVLSGAAGIVGGVKDTVEVVKGAIESFGGFFDTLGKNATRLAGAAQLVSVIAVIATLAFAIAYLGSLPREDVTFGLSVVIFMTAAIYILIKALTGLSKATTSLGGARVGSQEGIVNIKMSLGFLTSFALLLASFGSTMYLLARTFEILGSIEHMGQALAVAFVTYLVLVGSCVGLLIGMKKLTSGMNLAQVNNLQKMIKAIAAFLAAIGVAMILITGAMWIASKSDLQGGSADFLWLMMATVFGGMALMLKAMKGVKPGAILAASVMILAVAGVMYAIVGLMAILSIATAMGAPVLEPILAIVTVLAALGGMMWLIGNGWSKVPNKGFKSMAGIMWSLVGVLIAIAAAVYIIGESKHIVGAFIGLGAMLVVIGAVLLGMVKLTQKFGSTAEEIQGIALSFLIVAGALLLLGVAVKMMSEALDGDHAVGTLIIFGAFIVVLSALAFLAAKFNFAETFLQIGQGMMYAGAAFLLLGAGVWLLSDAMSKGAIALPLYSVGLNNLFDVFKKNWWVMLIILGFVVTITILVWKLGSIIGPIVQSIAEHVKNGAKAIGGVLKSGGEKLGNWIKGLSTKGKAVLIGVISGFLGAIAAMTPETLKTIGGILIKVIAYLGSIIGILAQALVEFLINLLNGLADAIQLNSASIGAAIWNVLIALFSLIIELLRPVFNALVGDALGNKVVDLVGKRLNEVSADMVANAKAVDDAKKEYRGLAEQLADVTKAADEMNNASEETKKNGGVFSGIGFGKNGEDVSVAPEGFDVTKFFGGGNAMDANAIKNFMNNGGIDAGKSFGYGVKDGVNLSGMPSELKNDYLAKFGEGNTDMYDYGMADGSDYTAGLADGFDFNNIEGMEGMEALDADNMLSEYSDPDAFQTASEENVDGLITGIDNKQDDVKAKMQETNDVAVIRLRAAKPRYVESAKHLLDGFIQGLREKKDDVNSEAKKIANEVSDTTDRAFKISSPSRVFAEKGMYVMMGLARGMRQNQDLALGATEDFGNAMIVSFGAPLEQIAAMVNGDIPIDPTVRPVMDMSSVGSSASSINSMFSNQNVTLSGLSGQIAADIGTLDQSNTAIIEELQNMRDDLNYMTEQINGMQVVMDSGALVGQIATPIDRSLGRRAIFKGRGN